MLYFETKLTHGFTNATCDDDDDDDEDYDHDDDDDNHDHYDDFYGKVQKLLIFEN